MQKSRADCYGQKVTEKCNRGCRGYRLLRPLHYFDFKLRKNVRHHVSVHIGQAKVTTGVSVRQLLVVQTQ